MHCNNILCLSFRPWPEKDSQIHSLLHQQIFWPNLFYSCLIWFVAAQLVTHPCHMDWTIFTEYEYSSYSDWTGRIVRVTSNWVYGTLVTVVSGAPYISYEYLTDLQVSGRTSSLQQYSYMMPKTINIGQRWDTTHATEAPPTIDSPSSRKFLCSPMVSSPLSHVRLFSLAFFCSASTQTVLTHTVASNRVQRSLAVEALNH